MRTTLFQNRKRPRPWAAAGTVLLASSLRFLVPDAVTAVPVGRLGPPKFRLGVGDAAESFNTPPPPPPPIILDALSETTPVRQDVVAPVLLEIILDYSGTNVLQLATDVDGVLEEYLLTNLQRVLLVNNPVLVQLSVTRTRRQRRRVLQRDILLRVEGMVGYEDDGHQGDCPECRQEDLTTELARLLTLEALDQEIITAQIDGVNCVTRVRKGTNLQQQLLQTEAGTEESENRLLSTNNATNGETEDTPVDGRGNPLEQPSLISIIFGFVLTGLAAMGLVFYACIFYKKRQKRLKKERLKRLSGAGAGGAGAAQSHLPSSRVTPTGQPILATLPKVLPKPPPSLPTTATSPALDDDDDDDNQSDGSAFRLDTMPSDGGPADAFARELQLAASLDERAWLEFQRKKTVLEHSRELEQLGSTSPIPPPPSPSPPRPRPSPPPQQLQVKTPERLESSSTNVLQRPKSFPYGDEPRDEGIELSMKMNNPTPGRMFAPRDGLPTEEKKDDYMAPRDPDPSVLQSIEQTLSPYNYEPGASDVVDEVARLSRFVRRYDKRKERRVQFDSERSSHVGSFSDGDVTRHISLDGSISSKEESILPQSRPPRQNENTAHMNNMRPSTTPQSQSFSAKQPRPSTAYRGITMAGEMYANETLQTLAHPSISLSSSGDGDSFDNREGDARRGQRLGITPFRIPKDTIPIAYANNAGVSPARGMSSRGHDEPQSRLYHEGSSIGQRARLSALRSNEAIIDSSQSDVNVGGHRVPMDNPTESRPRQMPSSRLPIPSKAPPRPGPPPNPANLKFSKLRNLFEDKEQKAIFPPDEYWQSGKLS